MSAAVLRTPTHDPSSAPVNSHLGTAGTDGPTHGFTRSAVATSNSQPPTTRPSFSSSSSSYSVTSAPRAVADTSQLGSSHSEREPHFPGAWVDTAPGTPAPLNDNPAQQAQQSQQQQVGDTSPTGRAREALPTAVAQYFPGTSVRDMTQVPGPAAKTETDDPSLLLAANDTLDPSRDAAGPLKRVGGDPQTESTEPTKVDSLPPVKTAQPANLATEVVPSSPHDASRPLEQVMGSTLSPDEQVQAAAKHNAPDSYVIPVVPIITTLGRPEHSHVTAASNPQPIHPVSSNAAAPSDNVHQNPEWSPRASRSSAIQRKANELEAVDPVTVSGKKGASQAPSRNQARPPTPPKSTYFSSRDQIKSDASSSPHSAYPRLSPPEGEGSDELSTCAVGGDTPVTSPSTSVGNSQSGNPTSRKAVEIVEQGRRPIFSEEHRRALETHHRHDAVLADDVIAGDATAAAVAATDRDEKAGKHQQHSTLPGSPKSTRFSSIRKLTKGGRHSRSSSKSEDNGLGRALPDLPAGAAFPESTHVINDDVGAPQVPAKDTSLSVSRRGGIVEPTPTVTAAVGPSEHKQHKLTKKPATAADSPPCVSNPLIPTPPGTSTGLRADIDTKDTRAHDASKDAPETGRLIFVNGSHAGATKPKLMDRIKGEVKIMQGTLQGDEAKKMEGRVLKEFGSL